jgi:2-polyprenyl-6-methoxyphenol hydroxylase-like FAD-dependent oxidoreductase
MGAAAYDAIVVGARCAGSPTAMLLANAGHRVLLVDRATFPSDTVSTHAVHAPGVAALRRWGLLERLEATGCPALGKYSYNFGPFTISGSPRPVDGDISRAYCPRRTVLDKLLLDAAAEAGVEVREGFAVEELVFDDGAVTGLRGHGKNSGTITESTRVLIGADGRNSVVAKAVQADQYNERPARAAWYYTYWSGLPVDGAEIYIRPDRGWVAAGTHDGLTLVGVGWPAAEFETNRKDIEGAYLGTLELEPAFAERVRAASREARFTGTTVPNFFRRPYGPGWALVGDAGYTKDPVTAYGIMDAFLSAERLTDALDSWLSGSLSYDQALAGYQRDRDEHALPGYELTCEFATLQPPPPDMQRLFHAVSTDGDTMDQFVSMMTGTLPVPEFFDPANVERILCFDERPAQMR